MIYSTDCLVLWQPAAMLMLWKQTSDISATSTNGCDIECALGIHLSYYFTLFHFIKLYINFHCFWTGKSNCYWLLPLNIVRTKWVVKSDAPTPEITRDVMMQVWFSVSCEIVWGDTQFWFKDYTDYYYPSSSNMLQYIINPKCSTYLDFLVSCTVGP